MRQAKSLQVCVSGEGGGGAVAATRPSSPGQDAGPSFQCETGLWIGQGKGHSRCGTIHQPTHNAAGWLLATTSLEHGLSVWGGTTGWEVGGETIRWNFKPHIANTISVQSCNTTARTHPDTMDSTIPVPMTMTSKTWSRGSGGGAPSSSTSSAWSPPRSCTMPPSPPSPLVPTTSATGLLSSPAGESAGGWEVADMQSKSQHSNLCWLLQAFFVGVGCCAFHAASQVPASAAGLLGTGATSVQG
jgi:hypothetical protein